MGARRGQGRGSLGHITDQMAPLSSCQPADITWLGIPLVSTPVSSPLRLFDIQLSTRSDPSRTRPVSPRSGEHEAELPRQGQCSIKPPPRFWQRAPPVKCATASESTTPSRFLSCHSAVEAPPGGMGDLGRSLIADVPCSPTFSTIHTGPALINRAIQLTAAKADTAVQPAGQAGSHVVLLVAVRD